MRVRTQVIAATCALLALHAASAADDKQRLKGLQDRLQKQQQQLMQLQDERQAAQDATQAAQKQAEGLRGEREGLRRQLAALQRELEAVRGEHKSAQEQAQALTRQLEEARGQTRTLQGELARSQAETRTVTAARDERAATLASCERTNAQLYTLNSELLELYSGAASRKASAGLGSLTLLGRVAVENQAEQLRDKLDEQRLPQQR